MDLISSVVNKVKEVARNMGKNVSDNEGFIRQGQFTPVQAIKDYFNPTSNQGQNFWSTPLANTLANVQQNVVNPIENDIGDIIASAPYTLSDINRNIQVATRPLVVGKFQLLAGQNDNVDVNPYNNLPAPTTDSQLEAEKQKVLNSLNLRPRAREYLSKIPIYYEKAQNLPPNVLGVAHKDVFPSIAISEQLKTVPLESEYLNQEGITQEDIQKTQEAIKQKNIKQIDDVIKHELLHQTPRLIPVGLFHPKNKAIIDYYVNRWGKDYMNQPGALVEEMFAEQDLPPAYYWHIFKNVVPDATPTDFISTLKSYFVNKINTPDVSVSQQIVNNGLLRGMPKK
jgi:hypothetical protein